MNQIIQHTSGITNTQNPGDANYIQSDPFLGLASPVKGLPFPDVTNIILHARKVAFQINTLGNTIHRYSSIFYSDIVALSLYFADWGFSYNTTEGAVHAFDVTIPWDTIAFTDFNESLFTSEQWEIMPRQVVRSLNNSGLFDSNGVTYFLPQIFKTAIELALKNNVSTIALPDGVAMTGTLASFIPQANLILQLRRAGIQGNAISAQTIKRTACVDINNVNGAFESVADIQYQNDVEEFGCPNLIYSSTDLAIKYPIPQTVIDRLLPSYSKTISVGSVDQISIKSFAGWMVHPPQVIFVTKNKMVFQQLFEWDEWLQYNYFFVNNDAVHYPLVNTNPSGMGLPLS